MDFYPSLPWVQSVWQKILWDLSCAPCFGSQGTEEPWEGLIWCYFSPTNSSLSDSKWLQKGEEKKSKHKYLEWKYKSPNTAVCQSRKGWQPKHSWWCPMSLKGSLGDLSMFNTSSRGSGRSLLFLFTGCSQLPMAPLLLWDLSRAWTSPQISKPSNLRGVSSRAGHSIFPLIPLCLQAEGWQGFHVVLPWGSSAFPPKHWAPHWDQLHLNSTQHSCLPLLIPSHPTQTMPPEPPPGVWPCRKGYFVQNLVPASGKTPPLRLLPSRHCGNPSQLMKVQTSTASAALWGRPQVLFSVAL